MCSLRLNCPARGKKIASNCQAKKYKKIRNQVKRARQNKGIPSMSASKHKNKSRNLNKNKDKKEN
jgi:hypothetical protein